MKVVLLWLGQQVIWISLICVAGASGYIVVALSARRKRITAQFSLEQDIYQQRANRAWLTALLFLILAGVIMGINIAFQPTSPSMEIATATPASGLFTLTPDQNLPENTLSAGSSITEVVVGAPALAGTAVPLATISPVPPEMMQPDCPNPDAQITFPIAGIELSGVIEVRGTARINAFSYYRFEVKFPGSDIPNFISQYNQSVDDAVLGTWDISNSTNYPDGGPYRFQLVVVDIYGNTTLCTIPVNIARSEE
ncbi:MAG: hypothetical protein P1S60_01985 [Anaerolineae bacterium]|nr:hypothetical protein [Anaerolineae bacterium]